MTDDVQAGTEQAPVNQAVQSPEAAAASAQADKSENAATSEQTDAGNAGAENPEGQQDEQPKPKARGGFQKRISELTREREKKAREADYWREQALRSAKAPEQPQTQANPDAPPRMEDFKTYEAYIEALAEHKANAVIRKAEVDRTQAQRDAQFNEAQNQFRAKLEKAGETYADFDEVLENITGLEAHPMVATAIMQSDKGVDILYWLGANPEEAARIHKMHPLAQVKELGRIEAQLPQAAARKVTQANPPPTTLKGGGTAKKDPSAMSMDEYVAWRKASA